MLVLLEAEDWVELINFYCKMLAKWSLRAIPQQTVQLECIWKAELDLDGTSGEIV